MELKVYNLTGEIVERETLSAETLGTVNKKLLYYAVNAYLANQRQGNASTKNKAEVAGGGKKPWKQKGTGRARVGSNRSPLWRKGGVIFGPKQRSYRVEIPAKLKQSALREALKDKIISEKVSLLSEYKPAEAKTRLVGKFLQKSEINGKILFFIPQDGEMLRRAGRNIPGVQFGDWKSPDFFGVLNADRLLVYREFWPEMSKKAFSGPAPAQNLKKAFSAGKKPVVRKAEKPKTVARQPKPAAQKPRKAAVKKAAGTAVKTKVKKKEQ